MWGGFCVSRHFNVSYFTNERGMRLEDIFLMKQKSSDTQQHHDFRVSTKHTDITTVFTSVICENVSLSSQTQRTANDLRERERERRDF